jgi:hypothetical protein
MRSLATGAHIPVLVPKGGSAVAAITTGICTVACGGDTGLNPAPMTGASGFVSCSRKWSGILKDSCHN